MSPLRTWIVYRIYLENYHSKVHKTVKNNNEAVVRKETRTLNNLTKRNDSPYIFFYEEVK